MSHAASARPAEEAGIDRFLADALGYAETLAAEHGLQETPYASGPVALSLSVLGDAYRDRLTAAIGFARGAGGPALRVIALDAQAGADTPPAWHFPVTDNAHLERLHERPDVVGRYDPDTRTWRVLSRARSLAVTWTADARALPEWEDSCPLRDILHWHSAAASWLLLHAAGIGAEGKGVLLAGAGGSGKSTTTAACVLSGLQTTGDDFVAVEPGRRRAHAIYDTIKLDDASLSALPAWQAGVANPARPADQKARLHLWHSRPAALARGGLSLQAILLPRVTGARWSSIAPATAGDALRALAPSTLFLLRGGAAAGMRKTTALLRALPAFRLDLGRDPMEAAAAIAAFLRRA
jgi:hypothetical protein